jgi:hypothetical protein
MRLLPVLVLVAVGALAAEAWPAVRTAGAASLVSAELAPTEGVTVGDHVTLTVIVEHEDGATVEPPGFGAEYGNFDLIEIGEPRESDAGESRRTTLTYTLTAFRTGTATLPPLSVTVRESSGEDVLRTPPISIDVESVLAPGDTTLNPLKPQLEIAEPAPTPLLPAAYVAAFAALTALGYVLVRRAIDARPLPVPPAPPPPPSPASAARAALDEIAASGIAATDPAAYYAGIAATVRRYLGARFRFPAEALTRRELPADMAGAGIDRWPARLTVNLLEQCDAVEFAGFRPAPERAESDLTAAYEIIDLAEGVANTEARRLQN